MLSVVTVAVLAAAISAALCRWRGTHVLIIFVLTLGLLQVVAITLARSSAFSVADDAAAGVLILWALVEAVRHRSRDSTFALIVLGLCGLVAGAALIRSPDVGIGIAQARQVAIPVGLLFAGYVLRDRTDWAPVFRWALALALAAAVFAIAEWMNGGPLLDPDYYYLVDQGEDPVTMREGLPSSYVSDTPNGTVVRSGGPFMNPPSLGFFLASGVVATVLWGYLLPLPVLALALFAAFARAGIVISGMTTLVAWTWDLFGKWLSLMLTVAAGGAVTVLFLRQGNTASHAQGLLSGVQSAFNHPSGQGFGTTGYQAAVATGDAIDQAGAESLMGLYAVWLGLPALVLIAALTIRLFVILFRQRVCATQTWAALAILVGAAASETASSLSAAALLWLVCGATLGEKDLRDRPPDEFRWKDFDLARRAMKGSRSESVGARRRH